MAETIPIEPMIGDTSVVSPTITPLAILADEQAQIPAESIAPYPFDDRSADVILRSSDRVLFYVYKSILIYSSQFFRGLFTIGQDPEVSGDQPSRSQSILDLSEHSDILKQVLHWCYPIPHTEPDTIETIESILVVAMKYDMAGVIFYMHRPLQNLDDPCAIPLFGLSCNVGFSDCAEDAAQMLRERHSLANISQNADWTTTVTHSIYTPKLVSIRAASFLRLLHFVRDGIKPSDFCQPEPNVVQALDTYTPISVWFSDGDLIVRPQFDVSVEFKVHTQIISFSSSILKDKIQRSLDTPGGDVHIPRTSRGKHDFEPFAHVVLPFRTV
ncbi:hypothetical protein QCA50_019511 [Cerrena zonata]|uniref:BTB domain-containing protein n=1 Tax=Cerrena zonata TaxID=2478898 RepID=A0AAW0F908_9APHY